MPSVKTSIGLMLIVASATFAILVLAKNNSSEIPGIPTKQEFSEAAVKNELKNVFDQSGASEPDRNSLAQPDQVISDANTGASDPNNYTLSFAKEFAQKVIDENQGGPQQFQGEDTISVPGDANLDKFFTEGAGIFDSQKKLTQVDDAKFKIVDRASKRDMLIYALQFQVNLGGIYNDMPELNSDDQKTNYAIARKLADFYNGAIDRLMKQPIPRDFLELHKREIALLETEKDIFSSVADGQNDPLKGLVALVSHNKLRNEFKILTKDYNKLALEKGLNELIPENILRKYEPLFRQIQSQNELGSDGGSIFSKVLASIKNFFIPQTEALLTVEVVTNTDPLTILSQAWNYISDVITNIQLPLDVIKNTITSIQTTLTNLWNQWLQNIWKVLMEYFKLRILDMMTNQIVSWITGGSAGSPKFIQNWSGFFAQSANDAINIVVNEVDKASNGLLCTPFSDYLRKAVRPVFKIGNVPAFQYQLSCTLDKIVQNINNFYADFSQGGWAGYAQIIQPNNNYYGTLVQVLDTEQLAAATKQRASEDEGVTGRGFLAVKRCKTKLFDAFGAQTDECADWEVTTPGNVLAGSIEKSITNRFDYIVNAQQMASIVAIVVDGAINKLIGAGINGLLGYGQSSGNVPDTGYISPAVNFTNCDALTGPEKDACLSQKNGQQKFYHLTCYQNTCTPVAGQGEDSCSQAGSSCDTHLACVANSNGVSVGACIRVPGAGADECTTENSGCTATAPPPTTSTTTSTMSPPVLIAAPQTINSGQSSILAWTVSGAISCSASGGWSGVKAVPSGQETVSPTTDTIYKLTCTDGSNNSFSASVTVTVQPVNTQAP